jgi:hypothetical protein
MMTMIYKVALGVITLAALTSVSMAGPLDDGIDVCGVPVCDLAESIEELKKVDLDTRGVYAISLMNKYKKSKDKKILNNLYVASKAMTPIYLELGDTDWVLRSIYDLKNAIVSALSKNSEVNSDKLTGYYKELSGQNTRFAMIRFWSEKIKTNEVISELEELIVFAIAAREFSTEQGDEAWVGRSATELVSTATVKLIALDPAHEGLYTVEIDESNLEEGFFGFDKVTVLDSSSSDNLIVTFINTKFQRTVYTYTHAEIVGNIVQGKYLSNTSVANSFEFILDRASKTIVGKIEKTDSSVINFAGKQDVSTNQVFSGEVPYELSEKDILGTLQGELAGVAGSLKIKTFKRNIYSATFRSTNGILLVHFQGKFFPKSGVLSLTNGEKLKLSLSLRETEAGINWNGFAFNTKNGTATKAKFSALK